MADTERGGSPVGHPPPTTRITVLVDNEAGPGLSAEHGFALWIEIDGLNIMFDTGQGSVLAANAKHLGIDLARTDLVVLSHGHYDHTGGLPEVLRAAPKATVVAHPGVRRARYSLRGKTPKSIGMPPASAALLDAGRCRWVTTAARISEHAFVTGPIPRNTLYEDTGGPFFFDPSGRRSDPIEDDQALWIQTPGGLVVCLGCGHAGVINTLQYVRDLSGTDLLCLVVGGLHLRSASEARMARTLEVLQSPEIRTVVPCHCTGKEAVAAIRAHMREKVKPGGAGRLFEV